MTDLTKKPRFTEGDLLWDPVENAPAFIITAVLPKGIYMVLSRFAFTVADGWDLHGTGEVEYEFEKLDALVNFTRPFNVIQDPERFKRRFPAMKKTLENADLEMDIRRHGNKSHPSYEYGSLQFTLGFVRDQFGLNVEVPVMLDFLDIADGWEANPAFSFPRNEQAMTAPGEHRLEVMRRKDWNKDSPPGPFEVVET